jgi:hypothetical protein
MREVTNSYKILIKKSEGEKRLEKPRHRWENNIKKKVTYKAIVRNGFIVPKSGPCRHNN